MSFPPKFPREPEVRGVAPRFLTRWSSRAFSDEPVDPDTLLTLFEAARWAPSSSNRQPWHFLYAHTEEDLERFRPLLKDGNREWADSAPVLAFALAKRHHPSGAPNRHAEFDTGAAWMSLALQAQEIGLATHAMAGIHVDAVYEVLGIPRDEWVVLCAIAIGYRGDPESLSERRQRQERPSDRKPLSEVATEGAFPA